MVTAEPVQIYLRLEVKVPPPQWKVGIRIRATFYFSGHSDIGGWQGTPNPQRIEIGLNMNVKEKNHFT